METLPRVRSAQRKARKVPAGTVTSSSASTRKPGVPAAEGGPARPGSSGSGSASSPVQGPRRIQPSPTSTGPGLGSAPPR
jgi:hypothetical protein